MAEVSTARQTTDTATGDCGASCLSLAVAVVVSGALRASLLRLSAVFTSTRHADRCAMATCTGVDAAGDVELIERLTLLAATMEMWLEIWLRLLREDQPPAHSIDNNNVLPSVCGERRAAAPQLCLRLLHDSPAVPRRPAIPSKACP